MRNMISAMAALVLLLILIVIAVTAPRWGVDSHRSGEWGPGPLHETWASADRPQH